MNSWINATGQEVEQLGNVNELLRRFCINSTAGKHGFGTISNRKYSQDRARKVKVCHQSRVDAPHALPKPLVASEKEMDRELGIEDLELHSSCMISHTVLALYDFARLTHSKITCWA